MTLLYALSGFLPALGIDSNIAEGIRMCGAGGNRTLVPQHSDVRVYVRAVPVLPLSESDDFCALGGECAACLELCLAATLPLTQPLLCCR